MSEGDARDFFKPHKDSSIKKVIGVASGKGGVGKSTVCAALAANFQKKGRHAAVLDADITGPSIPKLFGVEGRAVGDENGIYPAFSETGVQIMSVNLLLPRAEDPVLWRGPAISGALKQFWQDVVWTDVDYMFIDMPPGTGDVALTAFQSLPVDGIVIVASPQELVSMIVAKSINMAKTMNVKIIGLIENMSYMICPHCGGHIDAFGESRLDETAKACGVAALDKIAIDEKIASACDAGRIEDAPIRLPAAAAAIENMEKFIQNI